MPVYTLAPLRPDQILRVVFWRRLVPPDLPRLGLKREPATAGKRACHPGVVAPTPTLTPPPQHNLRPDPCCPQERGGEDAEIITVASPSLKGHQRRTPIVLALGIGDVVELKPKEVARDALDLVVSVTGVSVPKALLGMTGDILGPD